MNSAECETQSRNCSKCGEAKLLSDFRERKGRRDNRLGQCRDCEHAYDRLYATSHILAIRSKNANWRKVNRDKCMESCRRNRIKNRQRSRCYGALQRAISKGVIVKPNECSICGAITPPAQLHGHHEDYGKPLVVIWLCHWCHIRQHSIRTRR